jgi:hypothetical protein
MRVVSVGAVTFDSDLWRAQLQNNLIVGVPIIVVCLIIVAVMLFRERRR